MNGYIFISYFRRPTSDMETSSLYLYYTSNWMLTSDDVAMIELREAVSSTL